MHWTRFEGASAAIGHYVRLVHEGRISPDEGWEAICQYNAAMLRPAWPLERLQARGRPALGAACRRRTARRSFALRRTQTPPRQPAAGLQPSARCSTTAARCRRTSSRRAC